MEKKEYIDFIVAEAEKFAADYKLSPRERQILKIILVHSTKDAHVVAAELGIEPGTVRTYLADIYRKTKSKGREELTMKFMGFLTTEKPLPPMKIIAIDDDPAFLDKIATAVESVFHTRDHFRTVSGADSIENLLDELRSGQDLPNLILLDLYMPHLDGYEVIRKIRTDARLASIRIITFSSTADPNDIRSAMASGATSFVSKTADVVKLKKVLRDVFYYWAEISPGMRSGS